jgi:hypothetical protein
MRGPTFYQLHLLLDEHASEQLTLIDSTAERVQTLGGVAVGDPRHVAEITASGNRSAWATQTRTRSSPSGSAAALIATAVCDAVCGSSPGPRAAARGLDQGSHRARRATPERDRGF